MKAALITVWGLLVLGGMGALLNYKQTPGAAAGAPILFPKGTIVPLDQQVPTLVMLLHPRCPCSRASVSELGKLMTRVKSRMKVYVLMVLLQGMPEGDEPSSLASRAAQIEGVTVLEDRGGVEARRFGALTSGQTLLFTTRGAMLFSGGITPARGHEGDNQGSAELERLALDPSTADNEPIRTNVYGCALSSAEDIKR